MEPKYLGAKAVLFSILNKGETESADYAIAGYLLKHYQNIREINIHDMAECCFVDRSTIRRFFSKYGFHNFLEFKKYYTNEFEEGFFKDHSFDNYSGFINDLNAKIMNMMAEYTLKRDKTKDIETFIDRIHDAETVVLMGDESFFGTMHTIQQNMLTVGKIVFIVTNNIPENPVLASLKQEDLLIVFSLKGKYFDTVSDHVRKLTCAKMLLTLTARPEWEGCFDYISQLTKEPDTADENVYRKYAIVYYVDIMLHSYRMKYGRTKS